MKKCFIFFIICYSLKAQIPNTKNVYNTDIVIYGGTSSAIIAAVKAKQLGHSVLVISPETHLGGMTSSGLGYTDSGNTRLIGGLAKDFYKRVYSKYQSNTAWKWQKKSSFKSKAQSNSAVNKEDNAMWLFEPHVAEAIFEDLVKENNIQILRNEWLNRKQKLEKTDNTITSFYTLSGKKITGKIFIDATYEGDLMALAGVTYHVGRESNTVYNETFNGVQKNIFQHRHNFHKFHIDPFRIKGDKNSGLLPKIGPTTSEKNGEGDNRIQAYCYRLCLTKNPKNRIPFTKPVKYKPMNYELLIRLYKAGWNETFKKFDAIPNLKTDSNNHGPFSFDNIGMNYSYPEATYEERKKIAEEHELYQKGWLYFITTDPRIPKKIQNKMRQWGYAKDEFVDNGGFPFQLYIRESRRMIGEYIMTEQDVLGKKSNSRSIGMGSYSLDSHNTQRYVTKKGFIENEGDIGVRTPEAYSIDMGAILPKKQECSNLIVPVCLSSSHIAYGSIRMEPVFMILAESASQIASIAIKNKSFVQDVSYDELQVHLLESGQILNKN
ncbi:FAD-dependent oxidoreductase [Flavobacterium sp. IMCC34518]|uniref:FAD-dependent oxidoreductase n=1 Tax=Flavobacterium sp. IMCC34518 TaxID=3003623 RepID=UPI0024822149|nr:FAD-dependent oxidoreductase [Flavobacterium sp. IMCC34518]